MKIQELYPGLSSSVYRGLDRPSSERRGFGTAINVLPDEQDLRDRIYEPRLHDIPQRIDIPAVYRPCGDRRQERRRRRLVRGQGAEGSCTGQALATIIDIQKLRRAFGRPTGGYEEIVASGERYSRWERSRVSARMLYELARTYEFAPESQLQGSSIRNTLKAFKANGVCSETSAPYEPFDLSWSLTVDMAIEAKQNSLGAYYRVQPEAFAYHAALVEAGAVFVSAMIHEGWKPENLTPCEDREWRQGSPGGAAEEDHTMRRIPLAEHPELLGAHAFVVVGYNAEGFFVLNSWGPNWGLDGARHGSGIPGIALWSYEDWHRHVLDAWIIRLASASANANIGTGGFGRQVDPLSGKILSNTPRLKITGYYLNLDGNGYVRRGRYPNDRGIFVESARLIAGQSAAAPADPTAFGFERLLICFMSGFASLRDDARGVEGLVNVCLERGAYPLFVFWTFAEVAHLEHIISANYQAMRERHGSNDRSISLRVERELRDFGQLFWNRMNRQIADATAAPDRPLLDSLQLLIDAAASRGLPVRLAAHSDGALLMEQYLRTLPAASFDGLARQVDGIKLVGPVCLPPNRGEEGVHRIADLRLENDLRVEVVTYNRYTESDDSVGIYCGSYPQLVQNVFFPAFNREGMEKRGVLGLCRTANRWNRTGRLRHTVLDAPPPGVSANHFRMMQNPGVVAQLFTD